MIDVEAEVASYTYKPGVLVSVHRSESAFQAPVQTQPVGYEWTLRIAGEVLDSTDESKRNLKNSEFPITDDQLADADTFAF